MRVGQKNLTKAELAQAASLGGTSPEVRRKLRHI